MKWYEYSAAFVMLYPGVMSVYWTLSGLLYFLLWERRKGKPVFGGDAPMVSVLVPCFNEADNLDASIPHLLRLTYPNYELIFINDGSKTTRFPSCVAGKPNPTKSSPSTKKTAARRPP